MPWDEDRLGNENKRARRRPTDARAFGSHPLRSVAAGVGVNAEPTPELQPYRFLGQSQWSSGGGDMSMLIAWIAGDWARRDKGSKLRAERLTTVMAWPGFADQAVACVTPGQPRT